MNIFSIVSGGSLGRRSPDGSSLGMGSSENVYPDEDEDSDEDDESSDDGGDRYEDYPLIPMFLSPDEQKKTLSAGAGPTKISLVLVSCINVYKAITT